MDSYQPIYDAVRSRISGGDIGQAVEQAMNNANISFYFDMMRNSFVQTAAEYERPSTVFRPKLFPDGDKWCALYGDNLQEGVAGFGETPSKAMYDFDNNWWKQPAKEAV